jgi:glutamyl-tRNA reductase
MLQDFLIIQRKAIVDDFQISDGRSDGRSNCPADLQSDFSRESSDFKAVGGQDLADRDLEGREGISIGSWFHFKTCLRNIMVGPKDGLGFWKESEGDEIYQGEKAYQFLLEVISGLHSSLIGETEILGQFKNSVMKFNFPDSHFGIEMKKFFQALFEDVKKVRSQHLADLGSQSYGSILRKEMKRVGETEIHVMGAGHLCEEILPWLAKDGIAIHIHVRDVERGIQKFKNSKIIWHQLSNLGAHDLQTNNKLSGALIIAAPLRAVDLQHLLDESLDLKQVFDLRHDSDLDRLRKSHFELKNLKEFTNTLDENIELIVARTLRAKKLILQLTFLRTEAIEHRPFGWEDMTA